MIRFSTTVIKVAKTTADFPNTIMTQEGNSARESGASVTPMPTATPRPTIAVFRLLSPAFAISLTPVIAMDANTEMVAPPRTHCGIVVKREAIFGSSPAASMMMDAR